MDPNYRECYQCGERIDLCECGDGPASEEEILLEDQCYDEDYYMGFWPAEQDW